MPNTIILTRTVSNDHTKLIVTDDTVYTSPARGDVGVFLSAHRVSSKGYGVEIGLITVIDPEVTNVWEWALMGDGHWRYKYVAVPKYSGAATYAEFAAVYDNTTDNVYRSRSAGNIGNALSNTTFWTLIQEPTLLADNKGEANESLNIDSLIKNEVIYIKTQDKRDIAALKGALEHCSDSDRVRNITRFEILDIFVEGMKAAEELQEYTNGEKIARRSQAI